jgi:hypothetical protein
MPHPVLLAATRPELLPVTRTVIYVSMARLTDKLGRDWYIDYLLERGVPVEYWDVVSLLREEYSERGAKNPNYLHVVRSYDELETRLREAQKRDVLYVMLIPYIGQFTRIFRIFSKYDCRMLFIAWGAMPRAPTLASRRIASVLANPWWYAREIFYMGRAHVLRKLKLIKPFAIVFAAGEALTARDHYAAKVVAINLCDYDNYIKARGRRGRLVEGRYAVFLDINLPYHSDLVSSGYPLIDPVAYYKSLNRFFGLLEQEHGVTVVIAAHPKADYDATTFNGRQIHRLVTAELVKDADLVVCHTSTALSYAVLNAKPLVFVYTNAMADVYKNTLIRRMSCEADYLGSSIFNGDQITRGAQIAIAGVNLRLYERYKYSFLTTPESEQISSQDVFLREIMGVDDTSADPPQLITAGR